MSKNVLILSGSPRKGGNSDILCDEFACGALETGNEVEKIFVRSKKLAPCNACYYCVRSGGKCAIQDDMAELLEKMIAAEVIVMSSPVYFYSIDSQMKMLIDRCLARYTELVDKELYFIMTAAEDSDTVMDGTMACFQGFADCLEGSAIKGVLYGKGVYEPGTVKATAHMQTAYEMGRGV